MSAIDDAIAKYEERKRHRQKLGEQKADLERRREEIEAQMDRTKRELRGEALIPGDGASVATASEVDSRVAALRSEIEQLESAQEAADHEVDAALDEVHELAERRAPGCAEDAEHVGRGVREPLAELGRVVVGPYSEVVSAEGELEEAREALEETTRLFSIGTGDASDRRLRAEQRRRLTSYLRTLNEDATDEEIIGAAVAAVLKILRFGNSPVREHLDEAGAPPLRGAWLDSVVLPERERLRLRDRLLNIWGPR